MSRLTLERRTDLIFWRASGLVEQRDGYLVVSTPGRRGWYWGNLLIFDAPPRDGDVERWRALFARELGSDPAVRHELYSWSRNGDETESIEPFLAAGFELEESVALVAESVHAPPHVNDEITIRTIESDEDWERVLALEIGDRPPRFSLSGYTGYIRFRFGEYRRLAESGAGAWYGAFLDGELVASLGLYRSGTLGRFQSVTTAAPYRRRGICGTLVWRVSHEAFGAGLEQLVMAADEHYVAARIYESVGFRPVDRSAGLMLYPPEERRSHDA